MQSVSLPFRRTKRDSNPDGLQWNAGISTLRQGKIMKSKSQSKPRKWPNGAGIELRNLLGIMQMAQHLLGTQHKL